MIRRSIFTCLLMLTLSAGSAFAGTLSITNVGGGWTNPIPSNEVDLIENKTGQLTDSIYWGYEGWAVYLGSAEYQAQYFRANDSAYQFTPINPPDPLTPGTAFLLGEFVHLNRPLDWLYSSISSVEYAFNFSTNGTPSALNSTFRFSHNETNNDSPCPRNPVTNAGSVSECDDFVTVSNLALNALITLGGGEQYFFNLKGFSSDNGVTFSNVFQTQEGSSNRAQLYGQVTLQPIADPFGTVHTPEPASLVLLGSGLAVIARRARGRRSKRSDVV